MNSEYNSIEDNMQRCSIAICAASTVFILAAVISIICVVFVNNNNKDNNSNTQEASVGYVSTNSSLGDSSIVIPWNDIDGGGDAIAVQDSDISSSYAGLRATSDDAPSFNNKYAPSLQSQDEVSPLWENIDLSLYDNEDDGDILHKPSDSLDESLAEFRSITNLTQTTTFTTSQTTNKCTPTNQSLLRLILKTDNYPYETSWEILRIINTQTQQSVTIGSGPPANTNYERLSNYIGDFCLDPGAYLFRIKDKSATGDGICCEWGLGSYTLDLNGERIVTSSDENFTVRNYNFFVDQAIVQNDIIDPITIAETQPPSPRPTTANPTSAPSPNPTTRKPTPNVSLSLELHILSYFLIQ